MAKKFYAIRKGCVPGIYENWDEAKAQIDGFPGADYKGFMTRKDAENYMVENENDRSNEDPRIKNLKSVKYEKIINKIINEKKGEDYEKLLEQMNQLDQLVEKIIEAEDDSKQDDSTNEKIINICETHKDVDVIAFVDGSADKDSSNNYQSGKLGVGLALIDIEKNKLKKYSYVYKDKSDTDIGDIGWVLKGSNDSAEIIAAVAAMRLCKKNSFKSIRIYQDNERPAKYFSGDFANINNECGYWYIQSSLDAVQDSGIDVQYNYVPAHVKSPSDKKIKEEKYENKNQNITKVDFDTAIYFNEMVDGLANVKESRR